MSYVYLILGQSDEQEQVEIYGGHGRRVPG